MYISANSRLILEKSMHVHFIGIGGAGMSGIAKVLLEMGFSVSGSDLKPSRYTSDLEEIGAKIDIGHHPDNINSPDVIVISSAIPEYNVELAHAKEQNIPILQRAEMLAQIARRKRAIAVAGTHGKTTTTSMISFILQKSGVDPTYLIGGELNDIGSNARSGKGELCIVEADESDGSLIYLVPEKIIITNIDADHLDHYGSFDAIEGLFSDWISRLPENGEAIVYGDNSNVQRIANKSDKKIITFGLDESNDYYPIDLNQNAFTSEFKLCSKGRIIGELKLNIPGTHNVLNALAAAASCLIEGVEIEKIAAALAQFTGVKRRFQFVGERNQVTVVDDYAHHPTEVASTLSAAGLSKWNRIICVFQPHRYSRTKFLHEDFGRAFGVADLTIMTDVYSAGEEPIPGVSGKLLVDSILESAPGKEVVYLPKRMDIKDFLSSIVSKGDLVITMGAGDIWTVGEELLDSIIEENGQQGKKVSALERR